MTKEKNPNIDILMLVVEMLGELSNEMVFLGGCTTGLLTRRVGPTQAVDMVINDS